MKKLHVCLCKNCIEELDSFNPWIDKNKHPLLLSELEIEEVKYEKCFNTTDETGTFINNLTGSWYLY